MFSRFEIDREVCANLICHQPFLAEALYQKTELGTLRLAFDEKGYQKEMDG